MNRIVLVGNCKFDHNLTFPYIKKNLSLQRIICQNMSFNYMKKVICDDFDLISLHVVYFLEKFTNSQLTSKFLHFQLLTML